MRPINKGTRLNDYNPYQDAQSELIDRLGRYCSYCERWIASAIHVEHKMPKANYPDLKYKWQNFLLSCSNCNSGKASGEMCLDDYVWPDSDNTGKAFKYDCEGRVFPDVSLPEPLLAKVINTWQIVGLNRHPDEKYDDFVKPTDKDYRWIDRKQEWHKAERIKRFLENGMPEDTVIGLLPDLLDKGMFSIWLTVFIEYRNIRRVIVRSFKNTASDCFDADYVYVSRPDGQI